MSDPIRDQLHQLHEELCPWLPRCEGKRCRFAIAIRRAFALGERRGLDDAWLPFLGPEHDPSHCGLCGNTGRIDTRGKVFTPAGRECGVKAFCICPNGRAWASALAETEGDQ